MSARGLQRAAAERPVGRLLLAAALALGLSATWRELRAPGGGVVLVTREEWDHEPLLRYEGREQEIRRIVIHHDAVEYAAAQTGEAKVAALLRGSRRNEGWPDLPYHYLIDTDGRVFIGRPESLACETRAPYDPSDTLHIALLGNYSHLQPAEAQLAALSALVREKARQYAVPADAIRLHRQVADTDCPGDNLRHRLASTRWR